MELVQIQINAHRYPKSGACTLPRPKEVVELVDALSRYWGRVGVHDICKRCFAGELDRPANLHGCCGGCPNLGHGRCIAKPIGCAVYWCHRVKIPALGKHPWSNPVADVVYGSLGYRTGIPAGCFPNAVRREAEHNWQAWELQLLRILRHAVDALAV